MTKRLKIGILVATFLLTLGISNTSQAKSKIKVYWDNHDDRLDTTHMYTAPAIQKGQQTGYMWNFKHTKRIHKLNNYKYTEWNLYSAVSVITKRGKGIYYKISNADQSVRGLVYHKYVTRALAKNVNSFTSDAEYINYLKTAPSQKLARQILKLFPNSQVSLDLSKQVATLNGRNSRTGVMALTGFTNKLDFGAESLTFLHDRSESYKGYKLFGSNPGSFLYRTYLLPATGRVNAVAKMLDAAGYTAEKRAKMGNYQLGICIYDEVGDLDNHKNDTLIHPGGSPSFYLIYNVVLGEKEN
ncbi:hypothetical protein [Lentilactobacillus parakefiri]|uniref:D-alanyl-D-alanine carboxypeptidase n=1 Tax=Lentilactobacillus parakefiri TaxID=152332 RepID=A0A269XZ13_9LACO|nr:hypothetical protein [Lentilactobacillus parakefiri]PAK78495.1 hypothetical protein B8W98_10005 [Lentilactobacillus parakefiri]